MVHRIHSVSQDGPVGQTGKINPGDFLIEVNGVNVLDMTHPEVVQLIQTLPRNIRLIVARYKDEEDPLPSIQDGRHKFFLIRTCRIALGKFFSTLPGIFPDTKLLPYNGSMKLNLEKLNLKNSIYLLLTIGKKKTKDP